MDKIKLKKTLYVGLGGTGVSTLLRVKKCFIDSYGEIPPMIGFLAIDTNVAVKNETIESNSGEKISLNPNELLVLSVANAYDTYKMNPSAYSWLPGRNVRSLSLISTLGAGQVRSNGRFIAYYNYDTINANLQSCVTHIHQYVGTNSRFSVDTDSNGTMYPMAINIIASIAGGTGSGMIVDTLCIVQDAIKQIGINNADIIPWLLLPDTYKEIAPQSPMMANVRPNAYGALRTLDYMQHFDEKKPLNFGYRTISECPNIYAFLFNNISKNGISFDKNDILDVIAKSAFLPANDTAGNIDGPFDNIKQAKESRRYNIRQKVAWAASTAAAELIYDSQAVARATIYRIVSQLCNAMIDGEYDGTEAANSFVDNQKVMIRENEGHDDVINSLLSSPKPEYPLTIDETTSVNYIQNYIAYNTTDKHIEDTLSGNLTKKLDVVKKSLDQKISNVLNNTTSGCVRQAMAFVSALREIIRLCNNEMKKEEKEFHAKNIQPTQWESDVRQLPKRIIMPWAPKYDESVAEALSDKLVSCITDIREEIRRSWAIRFYNDLDEYINDIAIRLQNLNSILEDTKIEYRDKLISLQQRSTSISKFQIYLHTEDIKNLENFDINKTNILVNFAAQSGGIDKWLSCSQRQVSEQLFNFTKETQQVIEASKKTIDDILHTMSKEEITNYLQKLKELAAPMWRNDTAGYNEKAKQLDKFCIVGVGHHSTSVIEQNDKLKQFFDENMHKSQFAETNQDDRIYLLVIEDLLPIYAVNNFSAYERDFNTEMEEEKHLAYHIDELLHNRMNSEHFDIRPKIDDMQESLKMWVYGILFGYIHWDADKEQYWIESTDKGSPINQYRYDLGSQRDVAYDLFKSEGFHKEIKTRLEKKIAKSGKDAFDSYIDGIRAEKNYVQKYAQLSNKELSQLNDPKFASVRKLVEDECRLLPPE